jgi:hypothetical protein
MFLPFVILFFGLLSSPAFAQAPQLVDSAFMQKAINVLQQQRNNALDQRAASEAKAAQLLEENAKLKAENEELKKKIPADDAK